jgi:hypothetical protein
VVGEIAKQEPVDEVAAQDRPNVVIHTFDPWHARDNISGVPHGNPLGCDVVAVERFGPAASL